MMTTTTSLALLALTAALPGAPREAKGPLALPPGELGFLEGSSRVEQWSGGRKGIELDFEVRVLYLVRPGPEGRGRELLLTRRLAPGREGGFLSASAVEIFALGEDLATSRRKGAAHLPALLEQYLGLDALLPDFPLPPAGKLAGKADLQLLGRKLAAQPLEVEVGPDAGGGRAIRRRLDEGVEKAALPLPRLEELEEEFLIDGAKALRSITRRLAIRFEQAGYTYEVKLAQGLEARQVRPLNAAEDELLATRWAEIEKLIESAGRGGEEAGAARSARALEAAFRRTALGELGTALVAAVAPRAAPAEGEAAPPAPVEAPPPAERPAVARRGAPAPDFTLESLKGEKLSLGELARGKVVYLTFWGYG
jgi:hypothetical protein